MTEASSTISGTTMGNPIEIIATTVGKPFPDTEMKNVNPKTGETIPGGKDGEILVRGFHNNFIHSKLTFIYSALCSFRN